MSDRRRRPSRAPRRRTKPTVQGSGVHRAPRMVGSPSTLVLHTDGTPGPTRIRSLDLDGRSFEQVVEQYERANPGARVTAWYPSKDEAFLVAAETVESSLVAPGMADAVSSRVSRRIAALWIDKFGHQTETGEFSAPVTIRPDELRKAIEDAERECNVAFHVPLNDLIDARPDLSASLRRDGYFRPELFGPAITGAGLHDISEEWSDLQRLCVARGIATSSDIVFDRSLASFRASLDTRPGQP